MNMDVPVYINWGRFVVDCPCGDAREVEPGQQTVACVDGHLMNLEWPDNAPEVMTVLSERTFPRRRNWFPKNHPLAVTLGQPHGQTLDDLRREAEIGEAADADALASRKAQLIEQLRDAGVTPDEAYVALKGV